MIRGPRIDYICNKLGRYDLYAPTWEEVLNVTSLTHILPINKQH